MNSLFLEIFSKHAKETRHRAAMKNHLLFATPFLLCVLAHSLVWAIEEDDSSFIETTPHSAVFKNIYLLEQRLKSEQMEKLRSNTTENSTTPTINSTTLDSTTNEMRQSSKTSSSLPTTSPKIVWSLVNNTSMRPSSPFNVTYLNTMQNAINLNQTITSPATWNNFSSETTLDNATDKSLYSLLDADVTNATEATIDHHTHSEIATESSSTSHEENRRNFNYTTEVSLDVNSTTFEREANESIHSQTETLDFNSTTYRTLQEETTILSYWNTTETTQPQENVLESEEKIANESIPGILYSSINDTNFPEFLYNTTAEAAYANDSFLINTEYMNAAFESPHTDSTTDVTEPDIFAFTEQSLNETTLDLSSNFTSLTSNASSLLQFENSSETTHSVPQTEFTLDKTILTNFSETYSTDEYTLDSEIILNSTSYDSTLDQNGPSGTTNLTDFTTPLLFHNGSSDTLFTDIGYETTQSHDKFTHFENNFTETGAFPSVNASADSENNATSFSTSVKLGNESYFTQLAMASSNTSEIKDETNEPFVSSESTIAILSNDTSDYALGSQEVTDIEENNNTTQTHHNLTTSSLSEGIRGRSEDENTTFSYVSGMVSDTMADNETSFSKTLPFEEFNHSTSSTSSPISFTTIFFSSPVIYDTTQGREFFSNFSSLDTISDERTETNNMSGVAEHSETMDMPFSTTYSTELTDGIKVIDKESSQGTEGIQQEETSTIDFSEDMRNMSRPSTEGTLAETMDKIVTNGPYISETESEGTAESFKTETQTQIPTLPVKGISPLISSTTRTIIETKSESEFSKTTDQERGSELETKSTIPLSNGTFLHPRISTTTISDSTTTDYRREGKNIAVNKTIGHIDTTYTTEDIEHKGKTLNDIFYNQVKFEELYPIERANMITAVIEVSNQTFSVEEMDQKIIVFHLWLVHSVMETLINNSLNSSGHVNGKHDDLEYNNVPFVAYVLPTPKIDSSNLTFTFVVHNIWKNETFSADLVLKELQKNSEYLKRSFHTNVTHFYRVYISESEGLDWFATILEKHWIIILVIVLITVGLLICTILIVVHHRHKQTIHHISDSDKLHRNYQEAVGVDLTPERVILQDEMCEKVLPNGEKLCYVDDDEGWLAPIGDIPVPEDANSPPIQDTKL